MDLSYSKSFFVSVALAIGFHAIAASAEEVGRIGVDWVGNDIIVEAVEDPEVAGVTCHVSYFERSLIDRLQKGSWFEDPSNASIACRQTGPITIGDIDLGEDGEEIFDNRRSLIWKKLVVNRIYDREHNTLIYLAHSRQVQEGSAKMSILTAPLYRADGTIVAVPKPITPAGAFRAHLTTLKCSSASFSPSCQISNLQVPGTSSQSFSNPYPK